MSESERRVVQGEVLWRPSPGRQARSRMRGFMDRLESERGLSFPTYEELWRWSVSDLGAFWTAAFEHLGVISHAPHASVLGRREMPGTEWFPGARLNYSEHALSRRDDRTAIVACSEDGSSRTLTRAELLSEVARVASALRSLGVARGDRVVAYLTNVPEAVVAFLATASIGATWSSCSPDFGAQGVLDRFSQIEPKVLVCVDGYQYNGKRHDRSADLATIRAGLPTLVATIVVKTDGSDPGEGMLRWSELKGDEALTFEPVPFDHPLWILYSSGTTGLPKAIVQGHGGILLEHLKTLSLHCDLGEDDRFFWFTTTGWMMWNFLVSGLLVGSTIVLYDGSPAFPDMNALWRMAAQSRLTYFGTSAPYLMACRKAGIVPKEHDDLTHLRSVGSTGAPLPSEGFAWIYDNVAAHDDLLLASISGGTDACTAFVLSCPLLPVHAGEIQCRGLGAKVEAFDDAGKPVIGQVGELVITQPLPSMPLRFWNDPGGARLRESYFTEYPGIWRHGDWIEITERGSCVITGRSDSTLNRAGVRMGTSEFYGVVEALPEIADSLVVDTGSLGHEDKLWLFVVLREGHALDDAILTKLKTTIRARLSPRHVPDEIRFVAAIPRTINGKKLEIPVKKILLGVPAAKAANLDTLANPSSLEAFTKLAR